jgi:ABC-type oligopeptide transport system substrate-binding subunit
MQEIMSMKTFFVISLIVVISLSLLLVACGGSAQPTSQGETLLKEKCTQCHNLSRVESQKLSSDEWSQVVASMVARGAQLTTDEQTILVQYLAQTYGK